MTKHTLTALMLAGALVLAACGSGGDSSIRELAGVGAQTTPALTAQPTPLATETPDIAQQMFIQPPPQPMIVEVTRQVVDVKQVEVTRIVEVVVTPTPDIAGFPNAPATDESTQPCPVKYWRNVLCTATQAQTEQAASEVQP